MIRLFKRFGFIGVIIGVILIFTVKSLAFLPTLELEIKSLDTPLTVESKDSDDFTKNYKIKVSSPKTLNYDWGTDSFDVTGDKEFSKFHLVLNTPGVSGEVRSDVKSAKSVGLNLNTFIIRGAKEKFYFSIYSMHDFYFVIQGKMDNKNIMDSTIQAYLSGDEYTLNVNANNFTGKVKVVKQGWLIPRVITQEKLKNANNFTCKYLPDTKTIKVDVEKADCATECKSIN